MAQRMMVFIYLHKRRKLAPANVFNPITTFLERASDRQMSNIGRQSGNLIKLFSLLVRRVGNAFQ